MCIIALALQRCVLAAELPTNTHRAATVVPHVDHNSSSGNRSSSSSGNRSKGGAAGGEAEGEEAPRGKLVPQMVEVLVIVVQKLLEMCLSHGLRSTGRTQTRQQLATTTGKLALLEKLPELCSDALE